jgi:putative salt-induced outer membrane protein
MLRPFPVIAVVALFAAATAWAEPVATPPPAEAAPAAESPAPEAQKPAAPKPEGPWGGEASLGFLDTSGNTDTRSFNGKFALGYLTPQWTHTARLSALGTQTNGTTSDERYTLGYKGTREFEGADYAFGSLDYDNDRFAGVIERLTLGAGYGRHFLKGPVHTLDAELGTGATRQKLADRSTSESVVGLFSARYLWQISETSGFTQRLKVETSKDNTFVNPVSELKLVIAGKLFTTLGYEVRHNSRVPEGVRKTDRLGSVNLGYSFGKKPG